MAREMITRTFETTAVTYTLFKAGDESQNTTEYRVFEGKLSKTQIISKLELDDFDGVILNDVAMERKTYAMPVEVFISIAVVKEKTSHENKTTD